MIFFSTQASHLELVVLDSSQTEIDHCSESVGYKCSDVYLGNWAYEFCFGVIFFSITTIFFGCNPTWLLLSQIVEFYDFPGLTVNIKIHGDSFFPFKCWWMPSLRLVDIFANCIQSALLLIDIFWTYWPQKIFPFLLSAMVACKNWWFF